MLIKEDLQKRFWNLIHTHRKELLLSLTIVIIVMGILLLLIRDI
ncbi:MAG: hypothetical protein WHT29_03250 [Bacteroidales bacterium]|nr:hypothetical protein [Bacteroidales bacterium]